MGDSPVWLSPDTLDGYSGPIYYLRPDLQFVFWRPRRCPETESRPGIVCKVDDPSHAWPPSYLRTKYRDMVRATGLNYREIARLIGRKHQTARAWASPSKAISRDMLDLLEYRLRDLGYLGGTHE